MCDLLSERHFFYHPYVLLILIITLPTCILNYFSTDRWLLDREWLPSKPIGLLYSDIHSLRAGIFMIQTSIPRWTVYDPILLLMAGNGPDTSHHTVKQRLVTAYISQKYHSIGSANDWRSTSGALQLILRRLISGITLKKEARSIWVLCTSPLAG